MSGDAEGVPGLIRQRLAALSPQRLELIDDSARHAGHAGARSGGGHYRLLIVAAAFAGQPRLRRHRLVHEALGELMQSSIHALSVQALSPQEAFSSAGPPV
ncbi:BolA family protein [Accumulibacter sp.]|uniref:BolA family protein n=1 Tax=Accumulibacter sp. TaxID=2053492 RepID=UPI0025F4DEC0|nr:BolA family protein [Accumulibacter sp.]MCM8612880.1 BolA family transcriptional regulator [Accumulibacter sp.]MCM8636661.1 BolA family transcriptional regulator [Accumulibacter sp.]MCM8638222.1 BolA family transcriptional regulator [Accumulibacter sp.]